MKLIALPPKMIFDEDFMISISGEFTNELSTGISDKPNPNMGQQPDDSIKKAMHRCHHVEATACSRANTSHQNVSDCLYETNKQIQKTMISP